MKTKEIICPKCEYHFNGATSNDVWKCPHCGFKFIEARKKDKIESFEENENTEKEKTYGNISVLQLILKTNRNIFDWMHSNHTKIITGDIADSYSDKNAVIAFKLCIFFGWLGAHRFYTQKYISAVLYLLTGGFLGIGWIIDIVRMYRGKFKDSKGLLVDWRYKKETSKPQE